MRVTAPPRSKSQERICALEKEVKELRDQLAAALQRISDIEAQLTDAPKKGENLIKEPSTSAVQISETTPDATINDDSTDSAKRRRAEIVAGKKVVDEDSDRRSKIQKKNDDISFRMIDATLSQEELASQQQLLNEANERRELSKQWLFLLLIL